MGALGSGDSGLLGLFWAAFSRCRNGMILVDDHRRCVDVNDAFAQLMGYKRSELIGRRYHEFAAKPPLSEEAWSELIKGKDFYATRQLRRSDGRLVVMEMAGHRETVTGRGMILIIVLRRLRGTRAAEGQDGTSDASLTGRELEIVEMIALGMTGPEIASELHLSNATVRTHVRNAMNKLGTHSRAQLVAKALGDGIVPQPDAANLQRSPV
jgi:PAS domain S-box-containing protein